MKVDSVETGELVQFRQLRRLFSQKSLIGVDGMASTSDPRSSGLPHLWIALWVWILNALFTSTYCTDVQDMASSADRTMELT